MSTVEEVARRVVADVSSEQPGLRRFELWLESIAEVCRVTRCGLAEARAAVDEVLSAGAARGGG